MPVIIKTSELQYKDGNGDYHGINAVAEKKVADQIADLDAAITTRETRIDNDIDDLDAEIDALGSRIDSESTRANGIISQMQTTVDGIESQRQTMIASIASVAGQGTDTTLSQTGVAADAKATGDAVGDLNRAITYSDLNINTSSDLWQFNTGASYKRLETKEYLTAHDYRIIITNSEYQIGIAVYNTNNVLQGYVDATYPDQLNNSISFFTTSSNPIDVSGWTHNYKIKPVIRHRVNGSNVNATLEDYVAVEIWQIVYSWETYTDAKTEEAVSDRLKYGQSLSDGDDLNDITDGIHLTAENHTYLNAPETEPSLSGTIEQTTYRSIVMQTIRNTAKNTRTEYSRFRLNNTWYAWMSANTTERMLIAGRNITPNKVAIIKDGIDWYIRSRLDDAYDFVYHCKAPWQEGNYVFNPIDCRKIRTTVYLDNTISTYNSASVYKDCTDDIPAVIYNGNAIGANHGCDAFTKLNCTHSLTESAVGTVWTDNNGDTCVIVQVESSYLVAGYIDGNWLIVKSPSSISNGGTTINITGSTSVKLRRSAIHKTISCWNDQMRLLDYGYANYIKVVEKYDIADPVSVLSWLQTNVGDLNNTSYYSDDIPTSSTIGTLINTWTFYPHGRVTWNAEFLSNRAFTWTRVHGALANYFSGSCYGTVPGSSNMKTPTNVLSETIYIRHSGIAPYDYFLFKNASSGEGWHLTYVDKCGSMDNEERTNMNNDGRYRVEATKLYPAMYLDKEVSIGDTIITCCGWGPTTINNVYISATNLGNTTIVGMSCVTDFAGFVDLPNDLQFRQIISKSTGIDGDFTATQVHVSLQSGMYYKMVLN